MNSGLNSETLLKNYAPITGPDIIEQLRQLAEPMAGMKVVHVNSTRLGGGVAEILAKLVPMMNELGLQARWEVIGAEPVFYECTKTMHNGLQGNAVNLAAHLQDAYRRINERNAEELREILGEADVVFIHDPQPAPLLKLTPKRKGKWIWRCHIDMSHPYRPVWKFLRPYVQDYDASIFSLSTFAQRLSHTQYLVPPSIDPLSDKNIELDEKEIAGRREQFGLDPGRPLIAQISRFDRFKDPLGVIQAYRYAKRFLPALQLVLAGGEAADDPESAQVLREVNGAAENDRDIHVLLLPPTANREINALQRACDIAVQKSVREGFGLTVTESLWKGKPVIGGDTGGIRLQVVNHHTGFLVRTPEGAALRIQYLYGHPEIRKQMSGVAREFVRENFLLTRHLRDYLAIMFALTHNVGEWIEARGRYSIITDRAPAT
ncbi:MAG: glycosyltransferase [Kiritimatiellia bacterium]|jgi:trehalose synthase